MHTELEIRNAALEEAAKVLDEAAADWHRMRDPGMANHDKTMAKKIRALISARDAISTNVETLKLVENR